MKSRSALSLSFSRRYFMSVSAWEKVSLMRSSGMRLLSDITGSGPEVSMITSGLMVLVEVGVESIDAPGLGSSVRIRSMAAATLSGDIFRRDTRRWV